MDKCTTPILLALLAVLVGPAAGQDRKIKLRPGKILAEDLPLAARHKITDRLPEALVGKGYSARLEDGNLEIDTTGDGRRDRKLTGTKPVKLNIGGRDGKFIVVFKLFDTWYAGSASCLSGNHVRRVVTLLDADLDGKFVSENDYIRFGDGSFHRQHENRLLADGDVLLRYTFEPEGPALDAKVVAKPEGFNDMQWRGLQVANDFRSHSGLTPLELDPKRCFGCQKHAEYLRINAYDFSAPWDGVGSHDEVPGKPGYTQEGHDASHRHGTSGTGDAPRSILGQTRTMLHRVGFTGPVAGGLGVGAVDGYSVVGGDPPRPDTVQGIVVVPAPGQQGVYTDCQGERPRPDRDPTFYQTSRGYPVSVTFGRLPLTQVSIELFTTRRQRLVPVPGHLFSPEKPISKTRLPNAHTAFFVAAKALARKTTYLVRFRARLESEALELAWEFTTQ